MEMRPMVPPWSVLHGMIVDAGSDPQRICPAERPAGGTMDMSPADNGPDGEPSDLVARAASGDGQAMTQLLSLYRPRLRRMVDIRMAPGLRRRVDPSDVLQ